MSLPPRPQRARLGSRRRALSPPGRTREPIARAAASSSRAHRATVALPRTGPPATGATPALVLRHLPGGAGLLGSLRAVVATSAPSRTRPAWHWPHPFPHPRIASGTSSPTTGLPLPPTVLYRPALPTCGFEPAFAHFASLPWRPPTSLRHPRLARPITLRRQLLWAPSPPAAARGGVAPPPGARVLSPPHRRPSPSTSASRAGPRACGS